MDKIKKSVQSEPRKKEKRPRAEIERKPYILPRPIAIERPVSANWTEAVQGTLERLYARAKITCEPEAITNKKVQAVTSHDPKNGDIVVVDIGSEKKKILFGIKIR